MEKYAKDAYDVYGDANGWKDHKGASMRSWEQLTNSEKQGWMNAVHIVAEAAFENPTDLKLEIDQHIMTLKTSL